MMKKATKLYVIPGLGESTKSKNYREIIKFAKDEGFKVIPVNIHWSMKLDMTDFVSQADNKIPDNISNDYILGFSFGAYIAAILSEKKNARGYIFCSISPYFKENLKDIPKESKEYFGPKLFNSFKKYSFPPNVNSKAWFMIGEKDWPLAIENTKRVFRLWFGKKKLKIIKRAEHLLSDPSYTKQVKSIISTI